MISIVIPAYNEEKVIQHTIQECYIVLHQVGDENSEVIVVDDCSSDRTYEFSKQSAAAVLKHPHNIGYGRSLKDGIKAAKNDVIFITDADGTYPIASIPDLLIEYNKGFDMVVGARTGKHYRESVMKQIYRKILKFLVEFTSGRKIPDINSGLRVFSRKSILPYFPTLCDTFSFTTSLTLAYMMTGKYVSYIPISYDKRIGKTKVKLLKDSFRTLQFIIEAILYYNPIKIFIVFSILLLTVSLLCLIIAFFTMLKIAYILGIASIIAAIFIFALGLLSVQLKQIMTNTK
jgi:glycosyltransferase involved in cell wall biosynthesis